MFISLEGTEGVGKTTLIQGLRQYFEKRNCEIVITREPGGTSLAEEIRSLLLKVRDEPVHSDCELLLMYAARSQHISQMIQPALKQGKVVISDRFIDSSFAYQCVGRGIDEKKINILNNTFISILPDLTFWLDSPVDIGMQRVQQCRTLDRFEQEQYDFFTKVRKGYEILQKKYPNRIKRIDATQNIEQVLKDTLAEINAFYSPVHLCQDKEM